MTSVFFGGDTDYLASRFSLFSQQILTEFLLSTRRRGSAVHRALEDPVVMERTVHPEETGNGKQGCSVCL